MQAFIEQALAQGREPQRTPSEALILRGEGRTHRVLVNAGGVVGSYFEWTQNLYQHKWDEDEVNAELSKIMTEAYREVWETVQREEITFREAALVIGVGRVAHAAKLRGFV